MHSVLLDTVKGLLCTFLYIKIWKSYIPPENSNLLPCNSYGSYNILCSQWCNAFYNERKEG